jgi:hypothetical protein
MNIDHGVRNSIYRTGRAAALRARLTSIIIIRVIITKENCLKYYRMLRLLVRGFVAA